MKAENETMNKEDWIKFYEYEQQKKQVEDTLKLLESTYWKIDKNDFMALIHKTIHPEHQDKITLNFLCSIAEFNGYYPLLLVEIAKQFKGLRSFL